MNKALLEPNSRDGSRATMSPSTPSAATTPSPAIAGPRRRASGVSPEMWVQIVLCVVVAGLLLVVAAVPRKRSIAASDVPLRAPDAVLDELDVLRCAIRAYRADHGAWPLAETELACGDACEVDLRAQLTTRTRADGSRSQSARADALLGPYAEALDLVNPGNGLSGVRVLGQHESWPMEPDETGGWIYRPATGELRANLAGIDSHSGRAYYEL